MNIKNIIVISTVFLFFGAQSSFAFGALSDGSLSSSPGFESNVETNSSEAQLGSSPDILGYPIDPTPLPTPVEEEPSFPNYPNLPPFLSQPYTY